MAEVVPIQVPFETRRARKPRSTSSAPRKAETRHRMKSDRVAIGLNVSLSPETYQALDAWRIRQDRSFSGAMAILLHQALLGSIPDDPIVLTCVLPRHAPASVLGLLIIDLIARHPYPAYLRWAMNDTGYVFTVALPGP